MRKETRIALCVAGVAFATVCVGFWTFIKSQRSARTLLCGASELTVPPENYPQVSYFRGDYGKGGGATDGVVFVIPAAASMQKLNEEARNNENNVVARVNCGSDIYVTAASRVLQEYKLGKGRLEVSNDGVVSVFPENEEKTGVSYLFESHPETEELSISKFIGACNRNGGFCDINVRERGFSIYYKSNYSIKRNIAIEQKLRAAIKTWTTEK
jgi:hypothetical protein